MIKRIFLFALLSSFYSFVNAQGNQFNQYIFNGFYINPAYAGDQDGFSINSFYSSQWSGIEGEPQTVSIAADGAFNDQKVGLGLVLQADAVGAQRNVEFYGNYAYHIQLNDPGTSKLSFGLGFGLIQSGIDGSRLNASDNNDAYVPTGSISVILPDARFGVLYTNSDFFVSISADNLLSKYFKKNTGDNLLIPTPLPNYYLSFGTQFHMTDDVTFRPSLLVRDNPLSATSMDINAFITFINKLRFGITYRTDLAFNKNSFTTSFPNSNAMIFATEINVSEKFKIGSAVNHALDKLVGYGYGSHQLSLSFFFENYNSNSLLH